MELINRNKYVQTDDGKWHKIIQRNPIIDVENEKYFFDLVCDDGKVFRVEFSKDRHNRKTTYKYGDIMVIK